MLKIDPSEFLLNAIVDPELRHREKTKWHAEWAQALRVFRNQMELEFRKAKIRHNKGGSAVVGEVDLVGAPVFVSVPGDFGQEVLYRVATPGDTYGAKSRNHYVHMNDFLAGRWGGILDLLSRGEETRHEGRDTAASGR